MTCFRGNQAQVNAQQACGGIKSLLKGLIEQNAWIGFYGQPDVAGNFTFQLSALPPRVAKGDHEALWALVIGHSAQRLQRAGEMHTVGYRE